jgi:hypothetical protein
MTLPDGYWPALLDDYVTAYQAAFPTAGGAAESTPSRNALLLACSVAQHETANGLAWPGTNNFGAVQLRKLTAAEFAAYQAGTLHAGDYTPARDGVLHVDTHPLGQGASQPYPVWFAAFAKRTDGIAHFLKTLYADSLCAPDAPDATPASVALEMYCGHYFEGAWKDERPFQARRAKPLSPNEQRDVDDYAGAVNACLAMICGALASWDYGRDHNDETPDTRPDGAA